MPSCRPELATRAQLQVELATRAQLQVELASGRPQLAIHAQLQAACTALQHALFWPLQVHLLWSVPPFSSAGRAVAFSSEGAGGYKTPPLSAPHSSPHPHPTPLHPTTLPAVRTPTHPPGAGGTGQPARAVRSEECMRKLCLWALCRQQPCHAPRMSLARSPPRAVALAVACCASRSCACSS